jgi:hypothetical protein
MQCSFIEPKPQKKTSWGSENDSPIWCHLTHLHSTLSMFMDGNKKITCTLLAWHTYLEYLEGILIRFRGFLTWCQWGCWFNQGGSLEPGQGKECIPQATVKGRW